MIIKSKSNIEDGETPLKDNLELLNPKEAAVLLGIEEHTLAVWRSAKRYGLPYIKVGRLVRYRIADLQGFLQARTVCR